MYSIIFAIDFMRAHSLLELGNFVQTSLLLLDIFLLMRGICQGMKSFTAAYSDRLTQNQAMMYKTILLKVILSMISKILQNIIYYYISNTQLWLSRNPQIKLLYEIMDFYSFERLARRMVQIIWNLMIWKSQTSDIYIITTRRRDRILGARWMGVTRRFFRNYRYS